MAIVESRLKDGTLTLGTAPDTIDFSCQVTNCRVNSSYDDDGDAVETLCGDVMSVGRKLSSRSLAGTVIQDWTAAISIIDFCYEHDLETMTFSYQPNATEGPTLSGSLRLEVPAETFGGDVNTRITSDFEWQLTAELVRTPAAVGMAAGTEAQPEPQPA
jgi:hypothetical protein